VLFLRLVGAAFSREEPQTLAKAWGPGLAMPHFNWWVGRS